MNLTDLIDQLQLLAEELGDDTAAQTDVRLAVNPAWAFEYDPTGAPVLHRGGEGPVVFIGAGKQHGYLTDEATTAVWG